MKSLSIGAIFFLALQTICCSQVVFDCPQLPPLTQPAKDVYELRPQDIKVVMALGDSINAGFGMMGSQGNLHDDFQEYRGQSWSMGLDSNASTVASFLRFYTPGIVGGSLGNHSVEVCIMFCAGDHELLHAWYLFSQLLHLQVIFARSCEYITHC
jgi:hypothetical protein